MGPLQSALQSIKGTNLHYGDRCHLKEQIKSASEIHIFVLAVLVECLSHNRLNGVY